jgi:hypothetical protein
MNIKLTLSKDFDILDINQPAEKVFSWQKKQVVGQNFLKLCAQQKLKCPISVTSAKKLINKAIPLETKINQHKIRWELALASKNPGHFVLTGTEVTK